MNRLHQRAYLNAMGIQVWQRRTPDNDAVSVSCIEESNTQSLEVKEKISLIDRSIQASTKTTHTLNNPSHQLDSAKPDSNPTFQLYFQLWPCGTLWVSSHAISASLNRFQQAVSHYLTGQSTIRPVYSHFKWPYLDSSEEDQSLNVALGGLKAQWLFFEQKKISQWIAVDQAVSIWLETITDQPLIVLKTDGWQQADQKLALWQALVQQSL